MLKSAVSLVHKLGRKGIMFLRIAKSTLASVSMFTLCRLFSVQPITNIFVATKKLCMQNCSGGTVLKFIFLKLLTMFVSSVIINLFCNRHTIETIILQPSCYFLSVVTITSFYLFIKAQNLLRRPC